MTGDACRSAPRARSHRSAFAASGRRGEVGPGARRPASGRSPQALVERGWLHALISSYVSKARCSSLSAAARVRLRGTRCGSGVVTVQVEGLNETLLRADDRHDDDHAGREGRQLGAHVHRHQRRRRARAGDLGQLERRLVQRLRLLGRNDPRRDACVRSRRAGELLLELSGWTTSRRRVGICEGELSSGDSVLFFPECFSETGACPPVAEPARDRRTGGRRTRRSGHRHGDLLRQRQRRAVSGGRRDGERRRRDRDDRCQRARDARAV